MSNIEKKLSEVTELSRKRGEDNQDWYKRLVRGVADLSDADWESLPADAQDWYNQAADAANAKETIKDFPDAEKAEAEAPRRRGAATKPAEPAVGDNVTLTTKRGKVIEGEVVVLDADTVIVKDADGDEQEFARDRVESIVVLAAEQGKSEKKETKPAEPAVGDTIEVTTKRGKVIKGELKEIDGGALIVDDGAGEIEVAPDKIDKVVVVSAAKKAEAKKEEKSEKKPDAKKEEKSEKKITAKANGGVSVTTRTREIICEDESISKEDVIKALRKEELDFRDATIDLVYADTQKVIGILKGLKRLK